MINRIITKDYLLIHEVYVDGDCFTINVPEDKFKNFFQVMTSYRQDQPLKNGDEWVDQRETIKFLKYFTPKRQLKKMRKNKVNLMAKDQTISSSINYWKNMRWTSESFCGLKDQQANENQIWLKILNDLEHE